ncbi:LLM class flavin-dependent oxidoreductase [Gordonia caeni]|uniref:LLM class flavin-dependent oxidoreductase n=1 Tax=Gordonia caeni TaxID=1007097 RepID=A0ABP7PQ78_9ACTN
MSVFIEIAVGTGPGQITPAEADTVAERAAVTGTAGLRLVDEAWGVPAIDPTVAGAYLAGRHPALNYLVDAPTTGNAPYNLARRVASFDRATGGRSGLVLRAGGGDEISDAVAPETEPATETGPEPADRWAEYASILSALWRSFPADALLGNQSAAIVVDGDLVKPIDHRGQRYRVAGPLDGPPSPAGPPPLVAADPELLGWTRIAAVADAVIVDAGQLEQARTELPAALELVDRSAAEVALLVRVDANDIDRIGDPADLPQWAVTAGASGVILSGAGDVPALLELLRRIAAPVTRSATLRDALGLATAATDSSTGAEALR